ncbi:MAG: patatin family protein [Lachnospiraceae bacterium]|nr:patatin family protein [Lachnospiraceae bacterium]
MSNRVYSGLKEIPEGTAGERIAEGCLVLEGGAFRGLYTQGFLDALMVNDINIRSVIGVSAGALSGMNYVSGQIGRSARINLGFRKDSRYVGVKALLHSKSIIDIGFLTENRGILEPLDKDRFMRPDRRFVAVTTNCLTGRDTYFEKGKCKDIIGAVRASATMPYISPMVMVEGEPYLDGGCSCKIPYRWALDQGYEKIIVIRTREADFRKKDKPDTLASRVYRKYPELSKSLSTSRMDYNHQCDEIEKLNKSGRIVRYAPSEHVEVSRIEKDMEKLGDLYHLGWDDCLAHLEEIKSYLNIA